MITRDFEYERPETLTSVNPNQDLADQQLRAITGLREDPIEFSNDVFDTLPSSIQEYFPDNDPTAPVSGGASEPSLPTGDVQPGGVTGSIQYNAGDGIFGGDSDFKWDEDVLTIGNLIFNFRTGSGNDLEISFPVGEEGTIRFVNAVAYDFQGGDFNVTVPSGGVFQITDGTDGSGNSQVRLDVTPVTAIRTYAFPDASGTLALTSGVPTNFATEQLDNLSSTAVNVSILPGVDDSIDLGDDTHRWRDTYLGPGTLHIGTSTSDEGAISYNTGTNVLGFTGATGYSFDASITGNLTGNVTGNASGSAATVTTASQPSITTLANLTSIQGRTVTLADAGANAIFGWDDTAGAYENLTQAEARTVLGLGTAALVATDLADLNEATIEGAIDTLANLTSVQGRTVTLSDAGFDVVAGWDDSASAYKNFLLADILTEAAPAAGDFALIYGAEGDLRKVDWSDVGGGSGATTELDNLGTTAINAHLLFNADATYDIGASATGINDIHFGSGGVVNFDGGDVTITHSANTLTVAGGDLVVPDEAYDEAGWNGDLSVPTKNAVRDKFESLSAGSGITRGQAYALRFSLA